jgi:hypothetical protein
LWILHTHLETPSDVLLRSKLGASWPKVRSKLGEPNECMRDRRLASGTIIEHRRTILVPCQAACSAIISGVYEPAKHPAVGGEPGGARCWTPFQPFERVGETRRRAGGAGQGPQRRTRFEAALKKMKQIAEQ